MLRTFSSSCARAGVVDDFQLRFGPRFLQIPSIGERRAHIVAPMRDAAGDVTHPRRLREQPAIALEETVIDEIMVLDARERLHEPILIETRRQSAWPRDRNRFAFPARPCASRFEPRVPVRRHQALVERLHQIAALRFRDRTHVAVERVRKNVACAVLVKPLDLALAQQKDAAQHKTRDALRVLGRVRQRQR